MEEIGEVAISLVATKSILSNECFELFLIGQVDLPVINAFQLCGVDQQTASPVF
jgi:hypothetical protein